MAGESLNSRLCKQHLKCCDEDFLPSPTSNSKKPMKGAGADFQSELVDTVDLKDMFETRSSPRQLALAVTKLKQLQKLKLYANGFGGLLDLKITEIDGKLGRWVVEAFNEENCTLNFSNGSLKITEFDVHRILGLPMGGEPIELPKRTHFMNSVVKKWRGKMCVRTGGVNVSKVSQEVVKREEGGRWFLIQFVILFFSTMVESKHNGSCNLKILHILDNLEKLADYNWCQLVIQNLVKSKRKWVDGGKKGSYDGPLTFLTIFYLDAVECEGFFRIRTDPVLKGWTTKVVRLRILKEIANGGFGKGQVVPEYANHLLKNRKRKAINISQRNGTPTYQMAHCNEESGNPIRQLQNVTATYMMALRNEEQINAPHQYVDSSRQMVQIKEECCNAPKQGDIVENRQADLLASVNESNDCLSVKDFEKQIDTPIERHHNVEGHPTCVDSEQLLLEVRYAADRLISAIQDFDCIFTAAKIENSDSRVLDKIDDEVKTQLGINNIVTCNSVTVMNRVSNCSPIQVQACEPPMYEDPIGPQYLGVQNGEVDKKRKIKISAVHKSPFYIRKVDIKSVETHEEKMVCRWLFSLHGQRDEILFQTKGTTLTRHQLESLEPGRHVKACVIDAWSTLLNIEELRRSDESPARFFLTPFPYKMRWTNEDVMFMQYNSWFESQVENFEIDLRKMHLVFFPIHASPKSDFYCLIVFNLKNPAIYVMDCSGFGAPHLTRYARVLKVVKYCFLRCLLEIAHSQWHKFEDVSIQQIPLPWSTTKNTVDCGVILMRVMESYMGERVNSWNTKLPTLENNLSQLQKLRRKYIWKLVTFDNNEKKGYAMERVAEFNTLSEEKKAVITS